ncbi:MAG: extracellular solute-binding protein [Clostridia bacterium]|nr:extracellular solute-binding protein [Clostridia bacterium]
MGNKREPTTSKGMLKGIIIGFLVASILFSMTSAYSAALERTIKVLFSNIKVCVDGEYIDLKDASGKKVEPFIYNGTTYLPARAIAEALGKSVEWSDKDNTVFIGYNSDEPVVEATEEPIVPGRENTYDANQITWYYIGTGDQRDAAEVENAVNEYIKDKIGARIKLKCFEWGVYDTKLRVLQAAGEPFDICFTSGWTNNYYQGVSRGAFVDLTDLMDKYAPKTKEQLGKNILKGASIKGRLYAIPANSYTAHNWVLLLRQDLIDKYKLNTGSIKKFEDIEPMLKIIKENEPDVYPLEATRWESPYRMLGFEKIFEEDIPGAIYPDFRGSKVFNDYETPEAKTFFNKMRRYYQAGYIRKDAATVDDVFEDRRNGKVFAITATGRPDKADELYQMTGQKWVQVDLSSPVMTSNEVTGSMQAISTTSGNPERALRFLELFNTDKYLNNLINFGIEGKHYTKKSENAIELIPGKDNGTSSGYSPGTGWMFGNQFLNYLFPQDNPMKWDKIKAFNTAAQPSPLLGFKFNPEPVKVEIAALKNILNEDLPVLYTGSADPDQILGRMSKNMKDAGVDKVLAEMQKQVDEFLAFYR